MRNVRLLAAALLLAAATAVAQQPPQSVPGSPDKALHALFEREFRNNLEEFPESATYLGVPGYDHRLSDRSPASVARRKARTAQVIRELERFDAARLSTQDRISRDVMLTTLRNAREQDALFADLPFGAADGWMRVSSMNGTQLTLGFVVKATSFRGSASRRWR
jgi:uncharacterized protein (DUF885 family)